MRISVTIFVILMLTYLINASVLDPVIENVVHLKATKPPNSVPGIWKRKTIWKPRWVKEWKSAKVMKPVWRKVWSPIQIREWVPIPKPPPGWDSLSTPLIPIHPKPQKTVKPEKDVLGQGSYAVHSDKVSLWDPIPYPESQQPPPLPLSQPSHNSDVSCDKGGCDSFPSQTFNQQQISEIIGARYQTPEYFQNPEFSETVNHLTRVPPEGFNWRPPQAVSDFRFPANIQELPEFLVPPKFQTTAQITPNPTFETGRPWIPLPPENKIKGHFITKDSDQPYKFQQSELDGKAKNNTNKQNLKEIHQSDAVHTQGNRDFIQEAQLVGEYHYSTLDTPNIKLQPTVDEKEQVNVKLPQPAEEVQKPFKPLPKLNEVGVEKSRMNQQPTPESKQTSEIPPTEKHAIPHVQKKHITNQSSTNSNHFLQQETILKDIFQNQNPSLMFLQKNPFLINHSTTKVQTFEQNLDSTLNTTLRPSVYPIFIPPNHRFSSHLQSHNNNTTETILKSEKNNTVHIVFATTPADYYQSTENLKNSTTTEPYEIIFSSSLQATTEAVTRSPVIVITPANSKENL